MKIECKITLGTTYTTWVTSTEQSELCDFSRQENLSPFRYIIVLTLLSLTYNKVS